MGGGQGVCTDHTPPPPSVRTRCNALEGPGRPLKRPQGAYLGPQGAYFGRPGAYFDASPYPLLAP